MNTAKQSDASATAPKKLPVIGTARETYAVILRNPGAFLAAAVLPFTIYLLIGAIYYCIFESRLRDYFLTEGYSLPNATTLVPWVWGVDLLLTLLAITLLGLAWHAFTICGSPRPRWKASAMLARRWWRYLLWTAVLIVLTARVLGKLMGFALQEVREVFGMPGHIPGTLEINIQIFVSNAIELAVAAVWIRLALVLPMSAVSSRPYGLRQSWRDTRDQGVRFLPIIGLVYLPYAGVIELLYWAYFHVFDTGRFASAAVLIPDYGGFPVSRVAYELLGAFRNTLFMGIMISLLSVIFLQLKGRDLALAELTEDQSRPPFRERARAAITRAKYWRQPD